MNKKKSTYNFWQWMFFLIISQVCFGSSLELRERLGLSADLRIELKIILASFCINQYDFEYFVIVFLLPDTHDLVWKDLGINISTRRKICFLRMSDLKYVGNKHRLSFE